MTNILDNLLYAKGTNSLAGFASSILSGYRYTENTR